MGKYSKKILLHWLNRYNKEEDLYNTGLEEKLHGKFQKNRFMNKDDLIEIVRWKFQGRLKGRQKIFLNLLEPVKKDFIENVSKLAFQTEDDKTRLTLLTSIKGVGNALSSVILAFFEPNKYGVLDIHDWRELFGKEHAAVFTSHKHAITFFNKLREMATETKICCRDIEKALFKKNLEESKEGMANPLF